MPKRKRTLKVGSEGVEAPKLGSVRECRELHEKLWRKKQKNPFKQSHFQTEEPVFVFLVKQTTKHERI